MASGSGAPGLALIAATIGTVNSTGIAATTPVHAAGAVTVTVTNLDCQSGSLANGATLARVACCYPLTDGCGDTVLSLCEARFASRQ